MKAIALAYLIGYAAVLSIVLGALGMVMIAHLTGATWFVVLRRRAEAVVAVLPWFLLLFIPVVLLARDLYPWADPERLAPANRDFVEARAALFTIPFFAVRSGIYLASWWVIGGLLRRASLRQDITEGPGLTRRQIRISAIGLPIYALTVTLASFDWLMTLSLPWQSTIYGAYWWAGGFVGALALLVLLAIALRKRPDTGVPSPSAEHFHALGKLLLTGIILWAYFGFAQLLIIWIGDLPREVIWYLPRLQGEWSWSGALLFVGHFVLPFALLLSRSFKRHPALLAGLAAWMLLMHAVDTLWLVAPAGEVTGLGLVEDALAIALISASAVLFAAWRARSTPPYPIGDPRLPLSVNYRVP